MSSTDCQVCGAKLSVDSFASVFPRPPCGSWVQGKWVCPGCKEKYKKYGKCNSCGEPMTFGCRYYCIPCQEEGAFDDCE